MCPRDRDSAFFGEGAPVQRRSAARNFEYAFINLGYFQITKRNAADGLNVVEILDAKTPRLLDEFLDKRVVKRA